MSAARVPGHITISRKAITSATWLMAVAVGVPGCSDSSAPATLTVAAVAATDGQTAPAGTSLPRALSVRVASDGAPKSGVTVTWQASAGTIVPASGETDGTGLASATWTLGAVPGPMTASTMVAGAQGSPVSFHATAVEPPATVTAVGGSDLQTGVAGAELPQPLRVQVKSGGVPKAGVTVRWLALAGSLTPAESVTDGDGMATATWTLGTTSGVDLSTATIAGTPAASVTFTAQARPGPAVAIVSVSGSGQTVLQNHAASAPLIVVVTDQYANRVTGQAVTWTVESGPVAFLTMEALTDAAGNSAAVVAPGGTTGDAIVRAALPGGAASTDFTVTVAPPAFGVMLATSGGIGPIGFVSSQNGTRPAVDTIPAGRTMIWTLEFDYDLHAVASVGTPAFQGGEFPYALPSTVSVRFTTPGTYHYADPHHPEATGIVVVQ